MNNKDLIIDSTIKLLERGRNLPMFYIFYEVMVDNIAYENHLIEDASTYDWFSCPLSPDEIIKEQQESLKRFHNSKGYNPKGQSTVILSKCATVDKISFSFVREIVEDTSYNGSFVRFIFDENEIFKKRNI